MADVGIFAVDQETRIVRGLLVPFNELSRVSASKTKPLRFAKGAVGVPADPDVVGLSVEHDRFSPLGRAEELVETDEGIVAAFRIARTPEGDAWLADHTSTACLSAEVRDIRRLPGDYATAALTGASVVSEGAFASAALFSIDPDEGDDEDTDPAPAEPEDEPDQEPDEQEEDTVADAVAPKTMLASRRKTEAPSLTVNGFFSALRRATGHGDYAPLKPYLEDAEQGGLFAFADITFDGEGGLTTEAGFPHAWLGELWTGRRFQRRVVPLIASGTLTSLKATGWVWDVLPEVAEWSGNKNEIHTNEPTVAPKEFQAKRYAGGHDLAREFVDFGVTEVIDSYVRAMIDSYAKVTDGYALATLKAGATPFTTSDTGLLAIADGALAVIAADATPSFALVAPDVFREILATPHNDALEYLDAAIGLDGGSTSGFQIVPDSRLVAGDVIVGDRNAATAWELPGVPIRVSAPDLVKGGIDNAFFGYIAVGVTYPAALVKASAPSGPGTLAAPAKAPAKA